MLPMPKDDTPLPEEEIKTDSKPKSKAKKEKTPKAEPTPDGLAVYADAGARPNPGFGGWGIHGYLYSKEEPKRGNGCKYTHTLEGYREKAKALPAVTPVSYVDAYGTITYTSNNGAEIIAATNALMVANKHDLKEVRVITDSKYVVNGVNYIPNMIGSNWVKRDGTPYSNKEQWLDLSEQIRQLTLKNVKIDFSWVKGHNGDQGNTLADMYATIGVICSSKQQIISKAVTTKADGYWTESEEKHPLLYHKRMFFTSSQEHNVAGEYYLSFSDSDADKRDLHGEKSVDTSYSYVLLQKPDPYVEMLRTRIMAEAETEDALLMCRLETLFKREHRSLLDKFGHECITQIAKGRLDLGFPHLKEKEPLVRELNPPRIALRAVEAVNFLKGLLTDYLHNKDTDLVSTDLTKYIYEITDKKDCKIQGKFAANLTTLDVQAGYDKSELTKLVDLKLTLGLDLPDRNTLKRLEKLNPRLTVITWRESHLAVRYAVVISVADAVGIWAGFYCNFKYLDVVKPDV